LDCFPQIKNFPLLIGKGLVQCAQPICFVSTLSKLLSPFLWPFYKEWVQCFCCVSIEPTSKLEQCHFSIPDGDDNRGIEQIMA
jgi:hypothetical protein